MKPENDDTAGNQRRLSCEQMQNYLSEERLNQLIEEHEALREEDLQLREKEVQRMEAELKEKGAEKMVEEYNSSQNRVGFSPEEKRRIDLISREKKILDEISFRKELIDMQQKTEELKKENKQKAYNNAKEMGRLSANEEICRRLLAQGFDIDFVASVIEDYDVTKVKEVQRRMDS